MDVTVVDVEVVLGQGSNPYSIPQKRHSNEMPSAKHPLVYFSGSHLLSQTTGTKGSFKNTQAGQGSYGSAPQNLHSKWTSSALQPVFPNVHVGSQAQGVTGVSSKVQFEKGNVNVLVVDVNLVVVVDVVVVVFGLAVGSASTPVTLGACSLRTAALDEVALLLPLAIWEAASNKLPVSVTLAGIMTRAITLDSTPELS